MDPSTSILPQYSTPDDTNLISEALGNIRLQGADHIRMGHSNGCVNASEAEELDVRLWGSLPRELLEKILARLPLRNLMQARSLSRKWAADLFCNATAWHNGVNLSLESEVHSVSGKWDSYCPVVVGKQDIIGYNGVSKKWMKMLDLSYLPHELLKGCSITGIAGSLIGFHSNQERRLNIWVTNPLNNTWSLIHPPVPNARTHSCHGLVHIVNAGFNSYKVVVLTQEYSTLVQFLFMGALRAQIYDSTCNSWTTNHLGPRMPRRRTTNEWSSAYLGEYLYLLPCCSEDYKYVDVTAWNMETGQWITFPHPMKDFRNVPNSSRILICNSTVMMVMVVGAENLMHLRTTGENTDRLAGDDCPQVVLVFRLDPGEGGFKGLSRSPTLHKEDVRGGIASDDTCIYVNAWQRATPDDVGKTVVVTYDVLKDTWKGLSLNLGTPAVGKSNGIQIHPVTYGCSPTNYVWCNSAFRPGLSPFVEA